MDIAFQGTIDFNGHGRVTVELVRALADYCDSITVYPTALSVENPASHEWWTDMPSNVSLAEKKGIMGSYVREINQFQNYDVVHIHYPSLGSSAAIAKVLSDTPYLLTIHGYGSPLELVQKWAKRLQYFIDLKICFPVIGSYGKVATISEFTRDLIETETGLSPTVIPHGIRPGRIQNQNIPSFRVTYDIPEESDILLFVGRFHKYKDITTLLTAFKKVRNQYESPVELVLLGGGPNVSRVRQQVQDKGIADSVTFITDVSDELLSTCYNEATLFTFPSYGERFGLVYLEAMAAGLPVVYAKAGAGPEVVGNAGVAVKPRDPAAFADAILTTLSDTERQKTLSRRSRNRALEFSWKKAAKQYASLYHDLIGAK